MVKHTHTHTNTFYSIPKYQWSFYKKTYLCKTVPEFQVLQIQYLIFLKCNLSHCCKVNKDVIHDFSDLSFIYYTGGEEIEMFQQIADDVSKKPAPETLMTDTCQQNFPSTSPGNSGINIL